MNNLDEFALVREKAMATQLAKSCRDLDQFVICLDTLLTMKRSACHEPQFQVHTMYEVKRLPADIEITCDVHSFYSHNSSKSTMLLPYQITEKALSIKSGDFIFDFVNVDNNVAVAERLLEYISKALDPLEADCNLNVAFATSM